MSYHGESITMNAEGITITTRDGVRTYSGPSCSAHKGTAPEMAELDDFGRFQKFLKKPLSFGGGFALFALGVGILLVSNQNASSKYTTCHQDRVKVETERDARLQRIEEMVTKPKSVRMVAGSEEVKGKEKNLEVMVREKDGWFWKGRDRVMRAKKGAAPMKVDRWFGIGSDGPQSVLVSERDLCALCINFFLNYCPGFQLGNVFNHFSTVRISHRCAC